MSWIVTSLCNLILDVLQTGFINLSQDFLSVFGINIGSNFPTLTNASSPSLATTLSSIGEGTSFFDIVFPVEPFRYGMIVLAVCMGIFMFVIDLMKSKSAANGAESPLNTVVRFALGLVMVIFSYRIFIIAEYIFQRFYLEFQKVATSNAVLNYAKTVKVSGSVFSDQNAVAEAMKQAVNTSFNPDNLDKLMSSSSTMAGASGSSSSVISSLLLSLICVVALCAILIEFFRLLLEIVERYVLLGVFYYTAPLGFMTSGSKTLSNSFVSWVQMVVTQFLLLILNSFFINTFLGALLAMSSKRFTGTANLTLTTYVAYLLMLVAWLKVGQRFDQHLKGMGLSTAQCGARLFDGMRESFRLAKGAAKGVANKTGGAMSNAKKASDNARKQAEQTADKAKRAAEKASSAKEKLRQNNARKDSNALSSFGKNMASAMSEPNGKTGKEAMSKFMNSLDKDGNRQLSKALSKANMDANSAKLGGGKFSANTKSGGRFSMASSEAYARMSKAEKAGYINCGAGTYAKATAGAAAESSTMRSIMAAAAAPGVKEAATTWAKQVGYHDPLITYGEFGARVKDRDGRTSIITNTAFNGGSTFGESLGDGYRAVEGIPFRMDERKGYMDSLGFDYNPSNGSVCNYNQAEVIPNSPFESLRFTRNYTSDGEYGGTLMANARINGEASNGFVVQAAGIAGAETEGCIPFKSPSGTDMFYVPDDELVNSPVLDSLILDSPQGLMNEKAIGLDDIPDTLASMAKVDIPVASANEWTELDPFENFIERDPLAGVSDVSDNSDFE